MIPGFLITWATFPGVIVHELAHAIFCRLFRLKIYEVKYFHFSVSFRQPAGWVVHEPAEERYKNLLVSIGPFFVNTILGAIIGAPGALPVLTLKSGDPLDYFLVWLGVSIAMHAFPSTGDAQSIIHTMKSPGVSTAAKVFAYPVVGLIYLGAVASVFWADLLYGVAVAGLLPWLIVQAFA
jgi:hypothetical protein